MADADDDLVPGLRELAEQAAPAVAPGSHLGASEFERIRAGSDEPSLEASFRHLATCASCRARLAQPTMAAADSASKVTPLRRSAPQRALPAKMMWAAAALVALAVGYAFLKQPDPPERLAIAQRPYAGMMGQHPAQGASENTNLELSFEATSPASAFFVPCSAEGKLLSAPHWFSREGDRSTVVVAPRTFLPHAGETFGFVVWGAESAVRAVAVELATISQTMSLAMTESALTRIAQTHGARTQRLLLAVR